MADTTEQTVDTSQNDLLNFNWDDNSESFFGLGESTEEETKEENKAKPVSNEDPKSEDPKEEEAEQENESFFSEDEENPEQKGKSAEGISIYEDLYKDLKEAQIFKHVELEDGEELDADKFFELQQEEIEAEVSARLNSWANEDLDEDAKAFIKFKLEGGSTAEFFKAYQDSPELGEGDIEDENYQDSLIRYQLQKEGWEKDEIEDRLEYLTDSGKKEKFAERYHNKIQEENELKKQNLVKQAEENRKQAKQQEEQFKLSIKDTLESNTEINGIKFTDKDKNNLVTFLTKREKLQDGREITGFQRKLSESFSDPKKIALLAKILNDDFDFSSFEKSAITKKTREVKRNIEQRQSVRPTGSGSSSGVNSLASLFDK